MANKRKLKKELSLVLEIVVQECFFTREVAPDKNSEIDSLIAEAISLHQTIIQQQNIDTKVSFKKFYSEMRKTFVDAMLEILKKLEEIQPKD